MQDIHDFDAQQKGASKFATIFCHWQLVINCIDVNM
jgi:hypothetical protein